MKLTMSIIGVYSFWMNLFVEHNDGADLLDDRVDIVIAVVEADNSATSESCTIK